MPWLSLVPWKIVGIVVAIMGAWGYGYWGGVNHERDKQIVIAAKQLERALAEQAERHAVSMEVEKKHWLEALKAKEVTRTITKVIRDEKPSSDCRLSNGWVQRHDEAATNTFPNPTGLHYASDSGFAANEALEAVAENYGTCHEIRQIAVSCQDWIRQMSK